MIVPTPPRSAAAPFMVRPGTSRPVGPANAAASATIAVISRKTSVEDWPSQPLRTTPSAPNHGRKRQMKSAIPPRPAMRWPMLVRLKFMW